MTAAVQTPDMPLLSSPWLRWGALALIQLALIAIPLADRLDVQRNGEVVELELVPVDPRDLLRGDYVIINLAIGRVSKTVPGADGLQPGETVYVGLDASGGKAAVPVLVAHDRSEAGPLAIAGTVRSTREADIRIDYGMDAFFLPEGEGLEIERMETDRLLLEVSITEDGRSLPLNLLVDGKAFKSDAIF